MVRKREDRSRRSTSAPGSRIRGAAGNRATLITGPYPPLVQLVSLLPLLGLYELAAFVATRHNHSSLVDVQLQRLLGSIDLSPFYLPGLLILIVLFLVHIYRRDPWHVGFDSVARLWGESLLLTVPLVAISVLFTLPWRQLLSRLSLANVRLGDLYSSIVYHIGVGLFEEFVFRLLLISVVLFLLERLFSVQRSAAQIVAICLSAALFAAAHHVVLGGEPYSAQVFLLRAVCGVYLGIMYMMRGFASAVVVHATFNVFVTLANVI
jgi:hypothetical protein